MLALNVLNRHIDQCFDFDFFQNFLKLHNFL